MDIDEIIVTDKESLQQMINDAVDQALMDHAGKFIEELRKDDLYTTEEIANKIGVSTSTIADYRKKGKIGYIQEGKVICYTREHYLDFIEENEIKSNNSD